MKQALCILICASMLLCGAAQAAPLPMKRAGVTNILLVGEDSYEEGQSGRSDVVILVQLDERGKTVRMASFLRDLYVDIPGHGRNRLNASYAWGGVKLLRQTLEESFGVSIDAHVVVDFSRLAEIIDSIGGVEMTLTESEVTQANGVLRSYNQAIGKAKDDGLIVGAGKVRLTGKQALCYLRIRHQDSDFARTARQRAFLTEMFHQVGEMDKWKLIGVARQNLSAVETDLSLMRIIGMVPGLLGLKGAPIDTLSIPDTGLYSDQTIDGMMVLVPDLPKCRQKLAAFFGGE